MPPHSPPARITFLSHAATPATRAGSFPLDEPLEPAALARLQTAAWKPPGTQAICAAPEQRTRETATALALTPDLTPALADCDYGCWRGHSLDHIAATDPEGLTAWLTDPTATPHGGESIVQHIARAGAWLETRRPTGHTFAITHPAVIRAALVHVLAAPPSAFWRIEIAPATLTDLRFNGRAWTVRSTGLPIPRNTTLDIPPPQDAH